MRTGPGDGVEEDRKVTLDVVVYAEEGCWMKEVKGLKG